MSSKVPNQILKPSKMPRYRVASNNLYFNQTLESYEKGLILGDSVLQFGDEIEASAPEAKSAVEAGDLVLLSS